MRKYAASRWAMKSAWKRVAFVFAGLSVGLALFGHVTKTIYLCRTCDSQRRVEEWGVGVFGSSVGLTVNEREWLSVVYADVFAGAPHGHEWRLTLMEDSAVIGTEMHHGRLLTNELRREFGASAAYRQDVLELVRRGEISLDELRMAMGYARMPDELPEPLAIQRDEAFQQVWGVLARTIHEGSRENGVHRRKHKHRTPIQGAFGPLHTVLGEIRGVGRKAGPAASASSSHARVPTRRTTRGLVQARTLVNCPG